ncbi:MAG: hypothetical protein HONBIEJF_00633 [Fimbriimonadaceae bacterium]|nr:hypothetical protein [Fimbriimonadaceae bacterium]
MKSCDQLSSLQHGAITRREILIGAATLAASPYARFLNETDSGRHRFVAQSLSGEITLRRYMAASVLLPDGRILVTGGFSRPIDSRHHPIPLNSAVLLDPVTGSATLASPMSIPRARHAAVVLADGRAVVLGGYGMQPTASVEVYDPNDDRWYASEPLARPRYDHGAVTDGTTIFVIGGVSASIQANVEMIRLPDAPRRIPR